MRYTIDTVTFPQNFKYIEVVKKGKPEHQKYDNFYINHPPIDLSRRAKIFSPFDALKGFNEAIASKDVLYEKRKELTEEDIRVLNVKLNILSQLTGNSKEARTNNVHASITYFVPCSDIDNAAYKVMGKYETVEGTVMNVDSEIYRIIKLNSIQIPIDDIISIESNYIDESLLY